jgi:signal transduction histidine kinase
MANLLSNAAKFSPAQGVVTIDVRAQEDTVRIAVSDQGSGIPEAFRDKIFQKFTQADSSDTRQKGGTGLGLAISKALVEHMHGSIGYESSNQGTTFYVVLPVSLNKAVEEVV